MVTGGGGVLVGGTVGARGDGVQVGIGLVVGAGVGGTDAGAAVVSATGLGRIGSVGVAQLYKTSKSSKPPLITRPKTRV